MSTPAHARLGCSNHRWPNCPGSIREEERYPDVSGDAAISGTGTHLLIEMCMDNNARAEQYDGQIIGANHSDNPNGWLIAPDRIERAQMCLDYIERRVNELKLQFPDAFVVVESESKANPGGYVGRDDWWGTVDITITVIDKNDRLLFIEVIDYKDGRMWVSVEFKDKYLFNTQLTSYIVGKMRPWVGSGPELVRPFKINNVGGCRITIVQPRTNPVIRYEDVTPQVLMDELVKLEDAAQATDDPNAPLVPGKHCQWCKANPKRGGHCTAETEKSLATVENMSTDIITTDGQSLFEQMGQLAADPTTMTSDQLADLFDAKDALVAAFSRIGDEIQVRVEAGQQVPGYTMTPGKGSRQWNEDEETVIKALKGRRVKQDSYYPKKLISPAQLEKLPKDILTDDQKSKLIEKLVTTKAGKLSLTKVSRDQQSQADPFKDIEGEVIGDSFVGQCSTDVVHSFTDGSFDDLSFI